MRPTAKLAFVATIFAAAVILMALFSRPEIAAFIANNAGWDEVGQGSASGGGISENAGESGWPSIAIAGGNVPYIAWYDDSSGNKEIYVRRWNGSVWAEVGSHSASQGGISNNDGISTAPSIAIQPDGKPCIAWRDFSSGYYEIYLRCWNGTIWSELGPNSATGGGVSNQQQTYSVWAPSMAIAPDGTPYIAWDNNGEEFSIDIFVSRWNGTAWERLPAEGSVSNDLGNSWLPSLAIAPDGTPYVAWQGDGTYDDSEIYVRRWNGSSWVEVGTGSATGGGISRNSGPSGAPSLAISADGIPYVSWRDSSSGNEEIYIRRWNGSSWVEVGAGSATGGGISQDEGASRRPSLAINSSNNPCVAWQDRSQEQNEVYARCWYGSYWSEVDLGSASNTGISNNNGQSSAPELAIGSDDRAYTTWGDNSSGNYEIYVRSYDLPAEPPPTATSTPTSTATATATPSPTQTPTNTAVPATSAPTSTPLPHINLPIITYQLPPTPTRPPLFIGLNAVWEGRGFIRLEEYSSPGTHKTMVLTEMIDDDIVKAEIHNWYDPNPLGWESADWFDYYSVRTGNIESSSRPVNPAFKWQYSEVMPYHFSLQDGATVEIDGQKFRAAGPFQGHGAFGQHITYARLVNLEGFLYWANGGEWSEFVHPGDVALEFDINTRLLLKSDILRRVYHDGVLTQYTIQYIDYLTGSNAYSVQQISAPATNSKRVIDDQVPANSLGVPVQALRPGSP